MGTSEEVETEIIMEVGPEQLYRGTDRNQEGTSPKARWDVSLTSLVSTQISDLVLFPPLVVLSYGRLSFQLDDNFNTDCDVQDEILRTKFAKWKGVSWSYEDWDEWRRQDGLLCR